MICDVIKDDQVEEAGIKAVGVIGSRAIRVLFTIRAIGYPDSRITGYAAGLVAELGEVLVLSRILGSPPAGPAAKSRNIDRYEPIEKG